MGDALAAHDTAISYGGLPGVLNLSLVESAIARPYNGYYRPIRKKAAALVESLCRNHGFTDGNKRTCLLLLGLFLERSGYALGTLGSEDRNEAAEALLLGVAQGHLSMNQIEEWMDARLVRVRAI